MPVIGLMVFDDFDFTRLNADGTLFDVVLHEMGHVLGIGTLWRSKNLVENPIFPGPNPDNTPLFTGSNAKIGYAAISSIDSGSNIPVEDGKDGQEVIFNTGNGEGQGSVDVHWKKSVFRNELMTYSISPFDSNHPLSLMTIRSLEDVGYTVDISQADPFTNCCGSEARGSQKDTNDNYHGLTEDVPTDIHISTVKSSQIG
mmetsp:Transcript_15615/g.18928  ORF Transcript_15615/g.18928 Transcript_15615/m.18928 type:complete len:200 (-) Transcript_15615:615-1214(-)